jgi:phosphoglycolate phosphatase-like HAD superfamily hydrolase
MTFTALGFDYDGVLADSRLAAFSAAEEIARLFGRGGTIRSMREYRTRLAEIERVHAPEPCHADSLRVLHRLVMRSRAHTVPLFEPVLAILPRSLVPVCVISSALRATVLSGLAAGAPFQGDVLGHEDGLKEENLARWSAAARQRAVYVTDNVRDVEHCRNCGVASIAVGWGFDQPQDLANAKADWLVSAPADLEKLLTKLVLIGG